MASIIVAIKRHLCSLEVVKQSAKPSIPFWQVSGETAWTSRQDLMIPQAVARYSGAVAAHLLCMILHGCFFWEAVIPEAATPTSHSSMCRCLLLLMPCPDICKVQSCP